MFWKISCEKCGSEVVDEGSVDGRFVLHRHHDALGAHLDLRIEQDGYLVGWRVDGATLEGEPWATEKTPHPIAWLQQDGDAVRVDAGHYRWVTRDAGVRELVLRSDAGVWRVRLEQEIGLTPESVRGVCAALRACDADASEAGRLVTDGVAARRRAVERLCGLARELDGAAFDEKLWRKTLRGFSLDEIHAQLRTYEVRFDQKYPPGPVSRPEKLPDEDGRSAAGMAMAIACE